MPDHGARKHAKFSASNAHRWSVCPGQPTLAEQAPPEQQSEWAAEGTRAHEALESVLKDSRWPDEADAEMRDAIAVVSDYITSLGQLDVRIARLHEAYFQFPQDVVPARDCAGTLDIFVHSAQLRRIWIIDFKFGEGVAVDAIGNIQLLMYAAAAVWALSGAEFETVTLTIIQPRAFHPAGPVREWTVTIAELLEFVADVDTWLRRATAADAPLVPGDHCKWCPCAAICPALERKALALANENFAGVRDLGTEADTFRLLPAPADLTNERIGLILQRAPILEWWLKQVRDHAITQLRSSIPVPGFKLAEVRAQRRWQDDSMSTAEKLAELHPDALSVRDLVRMKTITDVEKRLTKPQREQLDALTIKESSGNLTLVPEDDTRPAVNAAMVAFAGVTVLLTEQELFT